jgi:hypothetical protein
MTHCSAVHYCRSHGYQSVAIFNRIYWSATSEVWEWLTYQIYWHTHIPTYYLPNFLLRHHKFTNKTTATGCATQTYFRGEFTCRRTKLDSFTQFWCCFKTIHTTQSIRNFPCYFAHQNNPDVLLVLITIWRIVLSHQDMASSATSWNATELAGE